MDLKLNSFNNYPQPVFTAQLKGTAIRSALRNAKDAFQLGEVSEIVSNIAQKGDNATIINCCADGTVTVSNDKFGIVSHKYNIKKWEQAENTGLDLLRNFSSDNGVLKAECKLIDYIFALANDDLSKQMDRAPVLRGKYQYIFLDISIHGHKHIVLPNRNFYLAPLHKEEYNKYPFPVFATPYFRVIP